LYVIANRGFFRTGTIVACFHSLGKHCSDKLRLKIYLGTGTNISVQPLTIKPGMSLVPTDLDGLRRLIALNTSESETGARNKHSEDDEKGGEDNRTRIAVS
jgi:hypothetical protein